MAEAVASFLKDVLGWNEANEKPRQSLGKKPKPVRPLRIKSAGRSKKPSRHTPTRRGKGTPD
jgi:hypothetical protein